MTPAEILQATVEEDLGVAVKTSEPEKLRQALYREIKKQDLQGIFSLLVVEDEVFIVRRTNAQGT